MRSQFGRDHCRVRTGSAPMILSTLRNLALNLLRGKAAPNKAAAIATADNVIALMIQSSVEAGNASRVGLKVTKKG